MNKKGSILAVVIVFIFIFTFLGMLAMRTVVLQHSDAEAELHSARAYYAAIYGTEYALFKAMTFDNIMSSSTVSRKKFLPGNMGELGWDGSAWHPYADEYPGGMEIPFGNGLRNILPVTVTTIIQEQDASDFNLIDTGAPSATANGGKVQLIDGFIPGYSENQASDQVKSQQFAQYRFYVVKTNARITNPPVSRTDTLYFFIAYSSGVAVTTNSVNMPPYAVSEITPFYRDINDPNTVEIAPIYRYYVRGRK